MISPYPYTALQTIYELLEAGKVKVATQLLEALLNDEGEAMVEELDRAEIVAETHDKIMARGVEHVPAERIGPKEVAEYAR